MKRVFFAVGLSLLNCGAIGAQASGPHFEFLHMWRSGAELRGLALVETTITAAGLEWREHAAPLPFAAMRTVLLERVGADWPPTATLWMGTPSGANGEMAQLFRTLSPDLLPQWQSYSADALDYGSYGGALFGLPLTTHVINRQYLNLTLLAPLGLAPPQSWQDLLDMAPRLQGHGISVLQQSDRDWDLALTFVSLLSAQLSGAEFTAMLEGDLAPERAHEAISAAFDLFVALAGYSQLQSQPSEAPQIEGLREGRALMSLGGDWAALSVTEEMGLGCSAPFGARFSIGLTEYVAFPSTVSARQRAAQNRAVAALSAPDFLADLTRAKGGVPSRDDLEVPGLTACAQSAIADWRTDPARVTLSMAHLKRQMMRAGVLLKAAWSAPAADRPAYRDGLLYVFTSG